MFQVDLAEGMKPSTNRGHLKLMSQPRTKSTNLASDEGDTSNTRVYLQKVWQNINKEELIEEKSFNIVLPFNLSSDMYFIHFYYRPNVINM